MFLKSFPNAWKISEVIFDIDGKQARLLELEKIMLKPDFWEKPEESKHVLKERADLNEIIQTWQQLSDRKWKRASLFLDMAIEEQDEEALKEVLGTAPGAAVQSAKSGTAGIAERRK